MSTAMPARQKSSEATIRLSPALAPLTILPRIWPASHGTARNNKELTVVRMTMFAGSASNLQDRALGWQPVLEHIGDRITIANCCRSRTLCAGCRRLVKTAFSLRHRLESASADCWARPVLGAVGSGFSVRKNGLPRRQGFIEPAPRREDRSCLQALIPCLGPFRD